ncbi:NUDIX domain-containing protein [Sediminibacterium roseum]|uniref:NUDIX domain-containing protein n=1 Tax=Sediminibacterium roseum TaxID=1978412 RepID=A0ABW9ZSG9_9BACT|nr:NUDIX domain-containing protein [Sediminibacterium roseum]NCI50050.1 NUDIX domain-containing protein [Sediminibacterium roseum]
MEKTKIIAGGGLVLNDAGALLMIFRRGKWDLPKGKLDAGETILACAVREVKEETGLKDVEHGELIGITYHEYFDPYLKEEVIKESHWYAMRARGEQQLLPQTEEDITEIKWVSGEELEACLENSYPNVVEIIKKADL